MSFPRLVIMVMLVSLTSTAIGLFVGLRLGKPLGYSLCVAEEDDDYIRTRKF